MERPSLDAWMKEAKAAPGAENCGMFLFHNGVVRATAKAQVRENTPFPAVCSLELSYDRERVEKVVAAARDMPGILYARVWINEGTLRVGDDMMLVLVGGDIRPHVVDALQTLVGELKTNCVTEKEQFNL